MTNSKKGLSAPGMILRKAALTHGTAATQSTFNPFAAFNGHAVAPRWSLAGLDPSPEAEWKRMRSFLGLSSAEMEAMLVTVEALFKRGHELVVGTYDALLANPDTAAILGWEGGADSAHLSERRRFFTLWLARLIGMDFSDEMAYYLFRAGKLHAAHGPRHTHVPPIYVTGSISLVNATFARFLTQEMPGHPAAPTALAGWNKVLAMHLHMMQMGYTAAQMLDSGGLAIRFAMFGVMRTITGVQAATVHVAEGASVEVALRKFFNYFPAARTEVFDVEWQPGERDDARGTPWFTVSTSYLVKPMWRVLLNGKDLAYITQGLATPLHAGDEVHLFPPGR
jgi:molybdopterin converting factor small subunit